MKEKRWWQITTCIFIVLCLLLVYSNHRTSQLLNDYQELVDDYQETCFGLIEVALKYRNMALGNFSGWVTFNFTDPYPILESGESYTIWELFE